jgi:hypothetical protein
MMNPPVGAVGVVLLAAMFSGAPANAIAEGVVTL